MYIYNYAAKLSQSLDQSALSIIVLVSLKLAVNIEGDGILTFDDLNQLVGG